ncbi:recombinase family protein [Cytobacillus firmus]|uniref:recombinase family protein n=1 Tax=Cytobacillus firmus TaxID=1399 RepID=UPI0018CCACE9|nr:recombinase family protein [Cytobacillus firmus]MBG9548320.1 integrase [Cytobacillus firmus]MBG9600830.1 integrase [Cytobacillus firmus]MED1938905.1 recombinase family protein [Cytobacillus firmus]
MKAALYIRVSTQEQVENYSIESQQEKLEAYCKSKGWLVYDVYLDPGYSGSTMERPALQRLLKDIQDIDVVVVYKLDRLSRSQRDTLTLIEDHFLKNSVEFVSITETLDTSTPFGKAMIGILSVFAQLERETIAERMRMGHIKRAEEGYRGMGGDYDPAGYARVDGELVVKEDEAEHIQLAFDLYEQYHSITKVQKYLKEKGYKVWRFRRYNDILRNKLYCGYVSFAGKHYKGRHKAIITEEQFERVQVLLSRHKGNNAHKAKASLFSGLLYCGKCGEIYHTYQNKEKNGTVYRYYLCRARRFPSEYDEKCMNKIWNYTKLEEIIVEEINNLIIEKGISNKKENKVNYDKLLKKVDEKMERIIGLYAEGNMPIKILNKQMAALEQEKEQLQDKKLRQEMQQRTAFSEKELKQYAIDLTAADFPTRQAIVQKLIKQIFIHGEDVEIVWNF